MPNQLGQAGAQPQKATKFAPLYTGRWSAGLWTNRSPLRDAATTRLIEKFYGAAGDALIAGNNVEITSRLTLARRPGNSYFDNNIYSAVDRFYDFRLFNATSERINVMVDQATALYSLCGGTKTLLWTKHPTGRDVKDNPTYGQSYMQSVGNSLYWGDGISNQKWLQTLNAWGDSASWNGPTTPFFSTFIIDPNGNIQQLTGTSITVTATKVTNGILSVTCDTDISSIVSPGCIIAFQDGSGSGTTGVGIGRLPPPRLPRPKPVPQLASRALSAPTMMAATVLDNQAVTVVSVSGNIFVANVVAPDYPLTLENNIVVTEVSYTATPKSGATEPLWSTIVPSASNGFQGGVTVDGFATWTNRGNPVENWGIDNSTTPVPLTVAVGASRVSWEANTYYSPAGAIIDPSGNLQQVVIPGKSGSVPPASWATIAGATTLDGGVTWQVAQTASSLVWQPHSAYRPAIELVLTSVAASSSGAAVYSGIILGGTGGAYAGKTFIVSGFANVVNNGVLTCTASTATTLTLQNTAAVAEANAGKALIQGQYIVVSAFGTSCLLRLAALSQPTIDGNVSAYLYNGPTSGPVGNVTLHNPTDIHTARAAVTTLNSLAFGTGSPTIASPEWVTTNGAAEDVGTVAPFPTASVSYQLIILASISIPVAGEYDFTIKHQDGMLWGMGNNASVVSGTTLNYQGQTLTAAQGFPVFGGTNSPANWTAPAISDSFRVSCPEPGVYPLEINYSFWQPEGIGQHPYLEVFCDGYPLGNGTPETCSTAPTWPAWSNNFAPEYPSVHENHGQLTWENIGPVTDFTWAADTNFALPGTEIIDPNGDGEKAYRSGISGTGAPTFLSGVNQLTLDAPNLIWVNVGVSVSAPNGTVSTFNGGWKYCVALVNTLDNTVSNCTSLSDATGNFVGVDGVSIPAGAGLPMQIDPQADYVAIFRTTDGQAVPFLIPGPYTKYTVPLSVYLASGYTDTTPDTSLNNLISGAIVGENTPPEPGAINLTFHINRLWYSVGNVVKWTAGADTPVGNGVSGTPPLNFANVQSLVKRIVPTATGLIVFTVSDVYVIQGQGTVSNPIQPPLPIMVGVGLLSYNALDVNGSVIGFFTSDNQFCIIDPSAGVSYAGYPIGDQLRLNNGTPGQSWNPANAYVAWYVNGEDQGWFLADGQNGWFRLISTPAPESGYTWSPFATIVGGCKAVQSIEVSPGVHKLLLGPVGTGPILTRDLTTYQDNGNNYFANAVIGSAVLAQPGQVAVVTFVTTESVRVGSPIAISVLFDDALPFYRGPFDLLKRWEPDPPGLKQSRSLYAQRFYLSEAKEEAACRHMQVQVLWIPENAPNELLSLTIFGGYLQET